MVSSSRSRDPGGTDRGASRPKGTTATAGDVSRRELPLTGGVGVGARVAETTRMDGGGASRESAEGGLGVTVVGVEAVGAEAVDADLSGASALGALVFGRAGPAPLVPDTHS